MGKRHARERYFIVNEGMVEFDAMGNYCVAAPSAMQEVREFRFSRIRRAQGTRNEINLLAKLGLSMVDAANTPNDPNVPAGFTYLGQFIDHDLTFDRETPLMPGETVDIEDLVQGRSPALDLDSVYGRGPKKDTMFYAADGVRLKTGTTAPTSVPPGTNLALDGYDLPRAGGTGTKRDQRQALIPDKRNDENLAVAQLHCAFIRFHNRIVADLAAQGVPSLDLFEKARRRAIKHYQWMIRTDFLPRIVDGAVLEDVFANGRKFFEPEATDLHPSMPVEFSVAAYRLGHSMIREAYEWNRVFGTHAGALAPASLMFLFRFSGTSGNLTPGAPNNLAELEDPNSGTFLTLPTNWVVDWRRLFDFGETVEDPALRAALTVPAQAFNHAKRIDTLLVNPLKDLPGGSFGKIAGPDLADDPLIERNLAFRNLARGRMLSLPSGQQMADMFGEAPLSASQIIEGNGGTKFDPGLKVDTGELTRNTPLWFYVLREAEFNDGKLGKVGSRIVAETFHRAMQGSRISILRDPCWRPKLGPGAARGRFHMTDLMMYAFDGRPELLNPLGE